MNFKIKKLITHLIANHSILFFVWIVVIIVLIGTVSFHFVESRSIFDSFYVTTVTMATVGYGDIVPVTKLWKIISIIYWFMWAPLFIWLTWLLLQSKFQKLIKKSVHSYHNEIKEAQKEMKVVEKLTEKLEEKEEELKKKNMNIAKKLTPNIKSIWNKIFKRKD